MKYQHITNIKLTEFEIKDLAAIEFNAKFY